MEGHTTHSSIELELAYGEPSQLSGALISRYSSTSLRPIGQNDTKEAIESQNRVKLAPKSELAQSESTSIFTNESLLSSDTEGVYEGSEIYGPNSDMIARDEIHEDENHPQRMDESWDIESYKDSGYGTASITSDTALLPGTTEARDCLLDIILTDGSLRVLLLSIPKAITSGKFERSFSSMVKDFSRDLRKEAQDMNERSVANIARISSSYFANSISNIYISGGSDIGTALSKIRDQQPQKQQLLESLLSGQDIKEYPKKDENDSDDDSLLGFDEGACDFPKIGQVKDFVINSQALENLRGNLREWLENIRPQVHELQSLEEGHGHSAHTYQACPSVTGTWIQGIFKYLLRPQLSQGYHRMEWTCVSLPVTLYGGFSA